jgi:AraC-like DNA-binding protein
MKERSDPQRLTNAQYLHPSSSFAIYRQSLHDPYGLHWHEFYELTLVVSGEGTNVVNGVPVPLGRGSLFLLTPADFHEIYPQKGKTLELYNVVFSEELLDGEARRVLFDRSRSPGSIVAGGTFYDEMAAEFRRLWEEHHAQRFGSALMLKGTLMRIFVQYARQAREQPGAAHRTGPLHPEFPGQIAVNAALTYLHHHFRERLTLQAVARQSGLSSHYFSECFRKTTGMPFQNYLQGLRLRFAGSLMVASDLPVTEVCLASGFHSLSHFERAFKRKFGATPREWRKRSRPASGK